jgi:hypothetical protein
VVNSRFGNWKHEGDYVPINGSFLPVQAITATHRQDATDSREIYSSREP